MEIKKIFQPRKKLTPEEIEKQNFLTYVKNFREKYIPEIYNQCNLLEYLCETELNHFMSISNRTDGKSTNYIHFFIKFSLDYDVGFALIVRHYTLRNAMQGQVQEIYDFFPDLESKDLYFKNTDAYVVVYNKDKAIGVIYDINKASDLKLHSNFLKKFPIIIYDEFLALESDYEFEEFEKLATIYESIDRHLVFPIIKSPIMVYLGNAVNFSSPVISGLNLFNILETHEINTEKVYGDIVLENHYNEKVNEKRNTSAFRRENHEMTTGQFKINHFLIATENDYLKVKQSKDFFYIKLRNNYLRVEYNDKNYNTIILSVEHTLPKDIEYHFNFYLKDNKENSNYLTERFIDFEHKEKYNKEIFLFKNSFSKDFITDNENYNCIKIISCISYYEATKVETVEDTNEKIHQDNLIDNMKERLFEKYFLGG